MAKRHKIEQFIGANFEVLVDSPNPIDAINRALGYPTRGNHAYIIERVGDAGIVPAFIVLNGTAYELKVVTRRADMGDVAVEPATPPADDDSEAT